MKRLILASASPRRAQLLTQIGLEFIAVTSGYAEREIRSVADVEEMALAKARTVYGSFSDDLILGADTAVFLAGDAFGKPRDEKDAVEMLKLLSGQVHSVVTGLALINGSREVTGWEKTLVKMRPLEEQEIKAYVATGEPMDKAGAYGAQGRAAIFVERVEGCYFNVVGLPLARLAAMLQSEGFPVWER